MPTIEQLSKLPKWAQQHIGLITMRLDEATDRLADWKGETKGPIVYGKYMDDRLCLPNATVTFELPGGEVDVRIVKDGLNISLSDMRIKPLVSNVIEIYPAPK